MGAGLRLRVLAAYTVALLLGIPIWYYTTLVPRAPLPHVAVEALHSAARHQQPWRIDVALILPESLCKAKQYSVENIKQRLDTTA